MIAAWIAVALLTALAGLQACVAAGAPWGRFVWGGRHKVLPRHLRIGSALSVALYAGFAWLLLARAGVLAGGSGAFAAVATWVLFGYFSAGVVMNLASRSPAERWTMAPACAALALLTWVVAAA